MTMRARPLLRFLRSTAAAPRRAGVWCLLLLLLGIAPLRAAIAYDAVSSAASASAGTTLSWTHTLGSGSNRYLLVFLSLEDSSTSDLTVNALTFNGTAMTLVPSSLSEASYSGVTSRTVVYYLTASSLPAAGSYTVSVTFNGTVSARVGGALSFTGVKQAAPDAVEDANEVNSSQSLSTGVTTLVASSWLVDALGTSGTSTSTPVGAGITERIDRASDGNSLAVSTRPVGAAGFYDNTWNVGTVPYERATYTLLALAPLTYTISGNVFEDLNYGGGSGRTRAASSGVARSGARVELYDSSGSLSTTTTTNASGNYTFTVEPDTYTVRVVNSTVTSSRSGYTSSALAVQTYRTNASTGSAVAVANRVGGEDPTKADAGNGATTLAALATSSLAAQSVTTVAATSANVTGVDFGYSFNVVCNVNNSGQGSLRQFFTNANLLSNTGLAQSGLTAGRDNAVFMLPNGTSAAGLNSSYTVFTSGVATISPTSALTALTSPVVIDAQLQPGWSSSPIVRLNGAGAGMVDGLTLDGGSSVVRGLQIASFGDEGISISGGSGTVVEGCWIGLNSTGTAAAGNSGDGILVENSGSNVIGGNSSTQRNVIGGNAGYGVQIRTSSATGNTVQYNYLGCGADGATAVGNGGSTLANVYVHTSATGATLTGNVIVKAGSHGLHFDSTAGGATVTANVIGTNSSGASGLGNGGSGIYLDGADSCTIGGDSAALRNVLSGNTGSGIHLLNTSNSNLIRGNYVGLKPDGTTALANSGKGIFIASGSDNTIGGTAAGAGNVIAHNTEQGVRISAGTGNAVLGNSTFSNGTLGIDLGASFGVTANDGLKTSGQANLLMDFPVFCSADLIGSTLYLAGYVGSAAGQSTFAGARVEIFKADSDYLGYGEGRTYLGALTSDAASGFSGSFSVTGLTTADKLTATATDGSNNTSEYSMQTAITANAPFSVSKTSLSYSDPVNGMADPKRLPGGFVTYTLTLSRTNAVTVDSGAVVVTCPMPAGARLRVADLGGAGSGPVLFADGSVASGLSYSFVSLGNGSDGISFSNNNGSSYVYAPTADGNGCDTTVTHLRITLSGVFAAASCTAAPSATLQFRVRID